MKKYEREIRELLEKMDSFVPDSPGQEKERERDRTSQATRAPEREAHRRPVGVMPQPIPIRPKRTAMGGLRQWLVEHRVSAGLQFMVGGILIIALGLAITEFTRVAWVAQLLGGIGAFVFLWPVLVRFFKGRDLDDGPKYWRDQPVESEGFTWAGLRGWFNRRSKGNSRNNKGPFNNRNQRW